MSLEDERQKTDLNALERIQRWFFGHRILGPVLAIIVVVGLSLAFIGGALDGAGKLIGFVPTSIVDVKKLLPSRGNSSDVLATDCVVLAFENHVPFGQTRTHVEVDGFSTTFEDQNWVYLVAILKGYRIGEQIPVQYMAVERVGKDAPVGDLEYLVEGNITISERQMMISDGDPVGRNRYRVGPTSFSESELQRWLTRFDFQSTPRCLASLKPGVTWHTSETE